MVHVLHSWVVGPLEPLAEGFAEELVRQGYTVGAASQQVALVAHLSRWMVERDLDVGDLTSRVVEEYVAARLAGYRNLRSIRALGPLLAYLRSRGALPAVVASSVQMPTEMLLESYRDYLVSERGLRPKVVRGYLDLVRPFIDRVVGDGDGEIGGLVAADVMLFMVVESRRLAPKTVQRLASALRSLLRFWHVQGLIMTPLVEAVPKVACHSLGLARALPAGDVAALLSSCDRASVAGCRDFAMLTLLSRVGLRSGEVAGLQLADVEWRCGLITVVGKGNRRDQLPLPPDVGEAIADYLQRFRPAPALDRSVFIRVKAPHRGLSSGGVTQAVAAAAGRAGLGTVYAHRLRHSAATSLLAAGASLTEIGQVLRHRGVLTTSVYAKVDVEALRALARPWPMVGRSR
jgi:site-specific recombinase XerD